MTTEFIKLQIENPPKQKKNDGGEPIHGDCLAKMARPEQVKGAGHATAGAVVMEDKRKKAGNSNWTCVQACQMGQGVDGGQRSKTQSHKLFAGHDCAAEGQIYLPVPSWNYTVQSCAMCGIN